MKSRRETPADYVRRQAILHEIEAERNRQLDRWGRQRHADGTGRTGDVEIRDMKQALCESRFYRSDSRGTSWTEEDTQGREVVTWRDIADEERAEANAEVDKASLFRELVQSVAVEVAWLEDLLEQRERGEW